jgi:hypothetical protein
VATLINTHENDEERRRSILGSVELLLTGVPLSNLDQKCRDKFNEKF